MIIARLANDVTTVQKNVGTTAKAQVVVAVVVVVVIAAVATTTTTTQKHKPTSCFNYQPVSVIQQCCQCVPVMWYG
jgi:hypothetical protein